MHESFAMTASVDVSPKVTSWSHVTRKQNTGFTSPLLRLILPSLVWDYIIRAQAVNRLVLGWPLYAYIVLQTLAT